MRLLLLIPIIILTSCMHPNDTIGRIQNGMQQTPLLNSLTIQRQRQFVLPATSRFYVGCAQAQLNLHREPVQDTSLGAPDSSAESFNNSLVKNVCSRLQYALSSRFFVEGGDKQQTILESLASAQQSHAQFMFYPSLFQWDDIETTFAEEEGPSGIDSVGVRLYLYDTSTGQIADVISIRARSGLLSFDVTSPSALLDQSFERLVNSYSALSPSLTLPR